MIRDVIPVDVREKLTELDDRRSELWHTLHDVKVDVLSGRVQPDARTFALCLDVVQAYCLASQLSLDILLDYLDRV